MAKISITHGDSVWASNTLSVEESITLYGGIRMGVDELEKRSPQRIIEVVSVNYHKSGLSFRADPGFQAKIVIKELRCDGVSTGESEEHHKFVHACDLPFEPSKFTVAGISQLLVTEVIKAVRGRQANLQGKNAYWEDYLTKLEAE